MVKYSLTDHDDTGAEALGGQRHDSDLVSDSTDGLALVLGLSKLGDEGVGGVRNDGANNTGEITRGESDTELSSFGIGFLGLSEDVGVEELDNLLEEEEFGHGVRDLEWNSINVYTGKWRAKGPT
jgi:hypothetical protein